MTERILDWLNQNRFRAYPFINDNGLVYDNKRIPECFLLDCLVVDTRHLNSIPELIFTRIQVTNNSFTFDFTYNGANFSHTIQSNSAEPADSTVVTVKGSLISGLENEFLYVKFVFSSHRYILENVGTGIWNFTGKILPTKIISSTASGVSGLDVNGSAHVPDFNAHRITTGDVHLVDGYRTQPVIQNGSVVVKVGTMYGEDPCRYNDLLSREEADTSCDDLLLFFCGQNGGTSGNVVIEGGAGVTVKQGSYYKAKEDILDTYGEVGIHEGEKVPCVEVVASTDLLNIYRPTVLQVESSSSSSDGSSSPDSGE